MDFNENKAFLQQFRRTNAQIIEESDSDTDSSATQPPTPPPAPPHPAPPPPPDRPSTPNSSAPTVSPPHTPPPSPPLAASARPTPPARRPSSRARHVPRRARTPSPASSASTVPPPSPGALNRVTNRTTPRAVTVQVHEHGIESLPVPVASDVLSYPRLRHTRFTQGAPVPEVALSNLNAPPPYGVLPSRIASHLSPFQRDGVTFLYRLYERRRGGLLADSMGLGKTVQAVCFLGAAFAVWETGKGHVKPPKILIVAPISVKENWKREFETWTPFRCMLYDRNAEPDICRALRNGSFDVLITGDNPVAMRGNEFFSDPLGDGKWEWDVVIMDEIHIAKNRNTKIFKSLSALPKQVMFGLTGTAVQNRLNELWNVMSLVVPETLWPSYKSFKADYTDVINKGTKRDASEYMRRKARDRITKLRSLLSKHMVRRPKSVIEAHLPGKTDYCVLMRMKRDGLQGYMYHRFQSSYDVKMLRDALLPCDCGSEAISKECCHRFPSTEENLSKAPIWAMVHKDGPCEKCPNCIGLHVQHFSRWLAAHVMLVLPGATETDQEKALARKKVFMYYLGNRAGIVNEPVYSLERDNVLSCKLNVALKLLKTYESNGNKTIIFYESLRLGEILRRWAERNHLNFVVIDGSITNGKRQGAVDRFNTEKDISTFFISKKAGATGLNIFGADRVLIFEPCWNPTLDLQAGDRAYRLGQKRVVHIIRLVVENTIEHYVFKTALSKSQISSAILDNTREEWRVRENEIGSIHAMLSMGDVFEGDSDRPDDFKVVEAEELINENEEGGRSPGGDSLPDPSLEEPDSLREDLPPGVDMVLGEDGVCLLDVDVGEVEAVENSSEDGEGQAEDRTFIPSESQFETDQVFGEEGACRKLVMHSTSARKRKGQVMGISESKRLSGINPDGAANINLDAADLADLSMSMGTQEEDQDDHWSGKVVERPTSRTVSNSRPQSRRRTHRITEAQFEEDSGDEVIRRKRALPKIATQTESFISARRNKQPRRRPLEEVLRHRSDDTRDNSDLKKDSVRKECAPRIHEESRQPTTSQAQPSRGRRKQENHRKTISKSRQSSKDSNQTKKAPASAFATRARVRR